MRLARFAQLGLGKWFQTLLATCLPLSLGLPQGLSSSLTPFEHHNQKAFLRRVAATEIVRCEEACYKNELAGAELLLLFFIGVHMIFSYTFLQHAEQKAFGTNIMLACLQQEIPATYFVPGCVGRGSTWDLRSSGGGVLKSRKSEDVS